MAHIDVRSCTTVKNSECTKDWISPTQKLHENTEQCNVSTPIGMLDVAICSEIPNLQNCGDAEDELGQSAHAKEDRIDRVCQLNAAFTKIIGHPK